MGAFIDLTGQRFGHLVVTQKIAQAKDGGYFWRCKCDCGKEIVSKSGNLRSGHTQSCGCYMKHRISESLSTHKESHGRLYNVWTSMKSRCYNHNNQFFSYYGGRGIIICDEWRSNYKAFRDWAMINGYDPDAPRGACTIDRIDNDGPYAPWNCRFVDMQVQRHNRRDSKKKEGVF